MFGIELQACIVRPSLRGCRGIDSFEIFEHGLDRGIHAVEIEPVESSLGPDARIAEVVVLAQPADEIKYVRVAPHPSRKSFEAAERIDSLRIIVGSADVAVDAVRVGPVAL